MSYALNRKYAGIFTLAAVWLALIVPIRAENIFELKNSQGQVTFSISDQGDMYAAGGAFDLRSFDATDLDPAKDYWKIYNTHDELVTVVELESGEMWTQGEMRMLRSFMSVPFPITVFLNEQGEEVAAIGAYGEIDISGMGPIPQPSPLPEPPGLPDPLPLPDWEAVFDPDGSETQQVAYPIAQAYMRYGSNPTVSFPPALVVDQVWWRRFVAGNNYGDYGANPCIRFCTVGDPDGDGIDYKDFNAATNQTWEPDAVLTKYGSDPVSVNLWNGHPIIVPKI